MAPKAHRFLYATDLSKYSTYGIHYAVKLAATHAAKLLIFHVLDQRKIAAAKLLAYFFKEACEYEIIRRKTEAAMDCMKNKLNRLSPISISRKVRRSAHQPVYMVPVPKGELDPSFRNA